MILATKAEGLICPACGQRAITESQKFWLSPLWTRACASCRTRVTIPLRDCLEMNWPLPAALCAAELVRQVSKVLINLVHSETIDLILIIVGILVVPIGLFLAGVAWGSIRMLDRAPRIGLVVRGAQRSDPETPLPR